MDFPNATNTRDADCILDRQLHLELINSAATIATHSSSTAIIANTV